MWKNISKNQCVYSLLTAEIKSDVNTNSLHLSACLRAGLSKLNKKMFG